MPGIWGVAMLLALGAASVASASSPQSLADVAKRERERRAGLAGKAPAPILSDAELEASRGASFSVTGREAGGGDVGEISGTDPESTSDEVDTEPSLTTKEIRDLRQKWERIWREQMQEAEKNLESAESDRYQCRAAAPYFFVPLAVDCEGVDERVAEAEDRLKEVRSTRYQWELLLPSSGASPR